MTNKIGYIYRTNYFTRTWTWVRRGALIFLAGFAFLVIPLENFVLWQRLSAVLVVLLYQLFKPKDDLAIDKIHLYHLSTSIIPWFSTIKTYSLTEITSVRCAGIHNDTWEFIDMLNGAGASRGSYNTMEISFEDGASTSMRFAISRDQLDKIVLMAYGFKKEMDSGTTKV